MEYGWGSPLEGIEEVEEGISSAGVPAPTPRLKHKTSSQALGRTLPGDRTVVGNGGRQDRV